MAKNDNREERESEEELVRGTGGYLRGILYSPAPLVGIVCCLRLSTGVGRSPGCRRVIFLRDEFLVKFFKHSGPLPNPTRTDNHDNSDNVAQRSRPSSVHTHHQSDRPTAQDSQRRGPRSPISIAAGDTPSAKLPGISAAPPLYAARGAAKA